MFSILRKWRQARRLKALLKTRAILQYHDGERWRYADPFSLWRQITQDPAVNIQRIAPEVDEGHEPETSQFIAMACRIFDVKRFDDSTKTGLLDWEIIALVGRLGDYTTSVKKNTNPGPNSPTPTDPQSSTGPVDPTGAEDRDQEAITKLFGDSTSTEIASPPVEPTPSSVESATA